MEGNCSQNKLKVLCCISFDFEVCWFIVSRRLFHAKRHGTFLFHLSTRAFIFFFSKVVKNVTFLLTFHFCSFLLTTKLFLCQNPFNSQEIGERVLEVMLPSCIHQGSSRWPRKSKEIECIEILLLRQKLS